MYEVDYNDKRFEQVKADKASEWNKTEQMYGEMIESADNYTQSALDNIDKWEQTQTDRQQQQSDFAVEMIEKEKQRQEEDYKKEQSAAYVDWQKQSDQYGANAEQMAAQGLKNTGYSESSQVAMYTAYQNRVAIAREAHLRITQDLNDDIKEAMLSNDSILAEIALQAAERRDTLTLQMLQYKNTLLENKANRQTQILNRFDSRWQSVLDQINTENALKEQARQFDEQMAYDYAKLEAEQNSLAGLLGDEGNYYGDLNYTSDVTNAQAYENAKNEHIAYRNATSGNKSSSVANAMGTIGKAAGAGAVNAKQTTSSASAYLDELVSSDESKTYKLREINSALNAGVITKAQADKYKNAVNKG